MSLKFALYASLFAAAMPAAAQPPASTPAPSAAPTGPAAAIQPAAMAFGQCLSAGVQNAPASVTPEAGATAVLAGCAAQHTALDQAVEALLVTLPADQQAAGRARYQSQIGQAQTQIADAIRQRNAAAAPATPATPAATTH